VLSRLARQQQPWCSTCHAPDTEGNPLTVDHTPEAWAKIAGGQRLSLADFTTGLLSVECHRCNVAKGNARGTRIRPSAPR
jgi:hypothetical protein